MFINKAERSCVRIATIALATAAVLTTAAVARPYSDINRAAKSGPINVVPLRGRISMLTGSGGNITALPGPAAFCWWTRALAFREA